MGGRHNTARQFSGRSLRSALLGILSLILLLGCSSGTDSPSGEASPSATVPVVPAAISLGVYGPPDELAAWEDVVSAFNESAEDAEVTLITWPDRETALNVLETSDQPDVFLSSMRDLDALVASEAIQPVGELLDEREVDFGDGFERTALRAFGRDSALQCMPYGMSPQVIYYNTELIDFTRMAERDIDVPEFSEDSAMAWNFDQFTAAAEFAARPARRIRGFHFEPTLTGLAPMLYAAGGQIFDEEELPPSATSMASDDTVEALETLLPVLRKSQLTLSAKQLERADPIEWFTRGKLGMIAGDHSLVPVLRRTDGLSWDILPFPRVEDYATVGDITGLCMSTDAPAEEAADLIVHAISADSVTTVAEAGYLLPTNLEVAESEEFLASGDPVSERVFNDSIRRLELIPSLYITPELEEAAEPGLIGLLYATLPDIETMTQNIDEATQSVLSPESVPSPSPSG